VIKNVWTGNFNFGLACQLSKNYLLKYVECIKSATMGIIVTFIKHNIEIFF